MNKTKVQNKIRELVPVSLYGGRYTLYPTGLIRSKKLKRDLAPYKTPQGYVMVDLWDGVKKKKCLMHRLVAEHFVDNPENKSYVNHKNGIRCDYNISNLEWVTASENNFHTWNEGGKKNKKSSSGEKFIYLELGRYVVRITSNGNSIYIGMHKDLKQAIIMRDKFIKDYGEEL